MELASAWRTLGIEPWSDRATVREAYVRCLFEHHPDVSHHARAGQTTATLLEAFRVVTAALDEQATRPPASPTSESPQGAASAEASGSEELARVVEDDTIAVAAPVPQTLGLVLDAANRLGEITYIEPGSGLVQALVEFVDGPICQLLLAIHPEPDGDRTIVVCGADSLDSTPAPPQRAVTNLVVGTINLRLA